MANSEVTAAEERNACPRSASLFHSTLGSCQSMEKKVPASVPKKSASPTHGRSGHGLRVEAHGAGLAAGFQVDHVQLAIAAGDERPAVDDGGRTADLILNGVFPNDAAPLGVKRVERGVLRAEQHELLIQVGGRVDFGVGLEPPQHGALRSVEAIKLAVGVAGVHPALRAGGRRRETQLGVILPL